MYDGDDDAKFAKRHSLAQLRWMMLALNLTCVLVNILLCRNLAHMVSRSRRAMGTTRPIHCVALAFNIVTILLLIAVMVSAFYPSFTHLYQRVQVGYFAI